MAAQPFTITDARGDGTIRFWLSPSAAKSQLARPQSCRGSCVLVATGGWDGPYAAVRLQFGGSA
jgi:hypothetical protein